MKKVKMTLLHEETSSSSIYLVLIALFLIAFFLRFYLLWQNLFFGPEQGIDFIAIKNIVVNHNLTLIGAKTDINGIFHGPIYYYLSVIPFLLGKGNPLVNLAFFSILNSLTVFLIYLLGKELFGKRVGIISAILFTVSFGSIIYSRWLSSPPLSIPLSCLFFIFISKFLKGSKLALIGAIIVYGLLGQSEFLNFLFFGTIFFLIILFFNQRFRKLNKPFLLGCIIILLFFSIGNYLLFDLRHQFLISKSVYRLIFASSSYYLSLTQSFFLTLKIYNLSFSSFIFPFFSIFSFLIPLVEIGALIFLLRKGNKSIFLIMTWLIVPPLLLIILRHDVMEQFFVSITPAVILTTSLLINRLWSQTVKGALLVLILIIAVNLCFWKDSIWQNKNIFFQSTQLGLKFSDQLKVIDNIYKNAKMGPFSFQAYTIPYWSQQGWEYLFWYYGYQQYGYLPIEEKAPKLYVIIQEDPSNKQFQEKWLEEIVSKWGKQERTFRHGILEVKELSTKWSYENSR